MASVPDQKSGPLSLRSFLLGCLIALCFSMGGLAVYVKVNLDRSESVLSAPDSTFTPDQTLYEKTVIALGYSGFLGAAQDYMNRRDRAAFDEMRMSYKTAQEHVTRIGDAASAPVRRDIRAIMDVFGGLIARADEGGDALSSGITNADLLVATTALNTLDSRLATALASNRGKAHDSFKGWSLALALLALSGFGLAGLFAAGALWLPQSQVGDHLRKLTQSVSNMVHGDMHKPIWGLERSDEIGELARSLDLARLYFTQMPDLSVMSEDGPVRVKFEGEARTLFQSMMRKITENYERAQQSTLGFTGTMNAQQDLLTSLSAKLNSALDDIQRQGKTEGDSIAALSRTLADAAKSLALTQENSTAQITRLVPFMQERVQNMAEVTHLVGQQVTQSLQSLMKSESAMRDNANQSQQTVKQLANATNQMGERMFAALNLMQATGKVLNETIDSVKGRFSDAVDTLTRGESKLNQVVVRAESRLNSTLDAEEKMAHLAERTAINADKMEKAVGSINDRHEHISEQVLTAAHRMDSIVANFDSAQRSMNDSAAQIRRDGSLVANLLAELRANNDQLLSSISQNSQTSFTAAQTLAEKSHALMQRLEVQIEQQSQMAETRINELAVHGQSMAQQSNATTSALSQTIASLKNEQEKLAATRSRFTETVTDLGNKLEQHATSTFGKTEQWAAQGFSKITAISEQMEAVTSKLGMLGQLTGTLGTVAGQLGQLVPTLTSSMGVAPTAMMTPGDMPPIIVDMEGTKTLILEQTDSILKELNGQWHKAVMQIEAMHDQLAQIVVQQKDQLETRLVVMDKKIREATEALTESGEHFEAEEKQTEIMNELIAAISKINEHVLELDEIVEEAGLRKEA